MDLSTDQLVELVTKRVIAELGGKPIREFMTFEQAADLLCLSPRTLRNLHVMKKGPKPTYVGRLVRFHRDDVLDFLQKRREPKVRP
jgi:excisionase family DNA binding protein